MSTFEVKNDMQCQAKSRLGFHIFTRQYRRLRVANTESSSDFRLASRLRGFYSIAPK